MLWRSDQAVLCHDRGDRRGPYLTYSIAPEDGVEEVLGKLVGDLQQDVTIEDGVISGNLAYTTGYTGFDSSNPELQSGHYLVLKFEAAEDAVVTVELVNGIVGHPVELDEDMNIVLRITDVDTQSVKVVVTEGAASMTKEYALTGLTLAEQ